MPCAASYETATNVRQTGTHVLFGGSWKTSLCRAWLQENLRPRRLWFHSVLGASSAMDFAAFLLHPSVAQTVAVSREKVKIPVRKYIFQIRFRIKTAGDEISKTT